MTAVLQASTCADPLGCCIVFKAAEMKGRAHAGGTFKARRGAVAVRHSLCGRLMPSTALERASPFVPAYLLVCFSVPVENQLLDKSCCQPA